MHLSNDVENTLLPTGRRKVCVKEKPLKTLEPRLVLSHQPNIQWHRAILCVITTSMYKKHEPLYIPTERANQIS